MREWPNKGEIRRRYEYVDGELFDDIIYRIIKYNYNKPSRCKYGLYREATVKYVIMYHSRSKGYKESKVISHGFDIYLKQHEGLMKDRKLTEDELDKLMVELL